MLPATYNFPTQYAGDTVGRRRFTVTRTVSGVTSPENLTGVAIRCWFARRGEQPAVYQFAVGSGITIVNAAGGVFDLNAFPAPSPGTYSYDIEFTYPDSRVRTYVAGAMLVREDVSQ
jgi:hypothetical protein